MNLSQAVSHVVSVLAAAVHLSLAPVLDDCRRVTGVARVVATRALKKSPICMLSTENILLVELLRYCGRIGLAGYLRYTGGTCEATCSDEKQSSAEVLFT